MIHILSLPIKSTALSYHSKHSCPWDFLFFGKMLDDHRRTPQTMKLFYDMLLRGNEGRGSHIINGAPRCDLCYRSFAWMFFFSFAGVWPRYIDKGPYFISQIAKFMGPTWGLPGSCRPQMGPMLTPWALLLGCISMAELRLVHWYVITWVVLCDMQSLSCILGKSLSMLGHGWIITHISAWV